MTEAVQIALIVGVPVFITAVGSVIIQLHTAFKTTRIESATNGTMHQMQQNDKVQAAEMAGMRKEIAMLLADKATAAEIARTLAGEVKAAVPALHVEANTQAIVDNTAATDLNTDVRAGVQQPKKWGNK